MDTAEGNYKINKSEVVPGAKCVCGHPIEAHGTAGKICGACECKEFLESLGLRKSGFE